MLGNHPELNKDSSGYFLEASSKTSCADKLGLNRKTILIGKQIILKNNFVCYFRQVT